MAVALPLGVVFLVFLGVAAIGESLLYFEHNFSKDAALIWGISLLVVITVGSFILGGTGGNEQRPQPGRGGRAR